MFENGKLLYAKKTPRTVITKKPKPSPKSGTSGSGFFISKLGHVITNQHIVSDCRKVTVEDNSKKQVTANVLVTNRRNDLALLRISKIQMASADTKSLIRIPGIKVVPLATDSVMPITRNGHYMRHHLFSFLCLVSVAFGQAIHLRVCKVCFSSIIIRTF